jgi:hypothetical protein
LPQSTPQRLSFDQALDTFRRTVPGFARGTAAAGLLETAETLLAYLAY